MSHDPTHTTKVGTGGLRGGGIKAEQVPPPPLPLHKQRLCLGVGSVNFCTLYFGGVLCNWSDCVPRVLPRILDLRCMMLMLCVQDVHLVMMGFGVGLEQAMQRANRRRMCTTSRCDIA